MINSLTISNFAIVKNLFVEFNSGMTVITGETGAGKSIAVDAISLCLGARSDSGMVRTGQNTAQVSVNLTLDQGSQAYEWLEANKFIDEEDNTNLTLRRVVSADGKSKSYINNHPINLSSLKEISSRLIHLYGQHASQILLQPNSQLSILDRYINDDKLLLTVAEQYTTLKSLQSKLHKVTKEAESFKQRLQIIELQIAELDALNLKENEFDEVFNEFTALSNLDEINNNCELATNLINQGDNNLISSLGTVQTILDKLQELDSDFSNSHNMIRDALVNIEEAYAEIQTTANKYSQDPDYFNDISNRLKEIENVARKLKVKSQDLYKFEQEIRAEYDQLGENIESTSGLEAEIINQQKLLEKTAIQLHELRKEKAQVLSEKVTSIMQDLNMEHAKFYVDLEFDIESINENGGDRINFMLQANLGQDAGELHKVASGGELSRIALSIQVLSSNHLNDGTIIFDEVDVGISGKTASIVGQMLQDLAQKTQVICVTHLPQVASYGNNHYQVEKEIQDGQTSTIITELDIEQRVHALAKLLGHQEVTERSLDNARDLLELSHKAR